MQIFSARSGGWKRERGGGGSHDRQTTTDNNNNVRQIDEIVIDMKNVPGPCLHKSNGKMSAAIYTVCNEKCGGGGGGGLFQVAKKVDLLAIMTWWNMNTVCLATKINAQQNGASCPSSTCNLRVMSIHFIIHQGPGPLSKPSSNVVCSTPTTALKNPLFSAELGLIRSPSSACFIAACHVHILLGSNYLWLFICLTGSKEGL